MFKKAKNLLSGMMVTSSSKRNLIMKPSLTLNATECIVNALHILISRRDSITPKNPLKLIKSKSCTEVSNTITDGFASLQYLDLITDSNTIWSGVIMVLNNHTELLSEGFINSVLTPKNESERETALLTLNSHHRKLVGAIVTTIQSFGDSEGNMSQAEKLLNTFVSVLVGQAAVSDKKSRIKFVQLAGNAAVYFPFSIEFYQNMGKNGLSAIDTDEFWLAIQRIDTSSVSNKQFEEFARVEELDSETHTVNEFKEELKQEDTSKTSTALDATLRATPSNLKLLSIESEILHENQKSNDSPVKQDGTDLRKTNSILVKSKTEKLLETDMLEDKFNALKSPKRNRAMPSFISSDSTPSPQSTGEKRRGSLNIPGSTEDIRSMGRNATPTTENDLVSIFSPISEKESPVQNHITLKSRRQRDPGIALLHSEQDQCTNGRSDIAEDDDSSRLKRSPFRKAASLNFNPSHISDLDIGNMIDLESSGDFSSPESKNRVVKGGRRKPAAAVDYIQPKSVEKITSNSGIFDNPRTGTGISTEVYTSWDDESDDETQTKKSPIDDEILMPDVRRENKREFKESTPLYPNLNNKLGSKPSPNRRRPSEVSHQVVVEEEIAVPKRHYVSADVFDDFNMQSKSAEDIGDETTKCVEVKDLKQESKQEIPEKNALYEPLSLPRKTSISKNYGENLSPIEESHESEETKKTSNPSYDNSSEEPFVKPKRSLSARMFKGVNKLFTSGKSTEGDDHSSGQIFKNDNNSSRSPSPFINDPSDRSKFNQTPSPTLQMLLSRDDDDLLQNSAANNRVPLQAIPRNSSRKLIDHVDSAEFSRASLNTKDPKMLIDKSENTSAQKRPSWGEKLASLTKSLSGRSLNEDSTSTANKSPLKSLSNTNLITAAVSNKGQSEDQNNDKTKVSRELSLSLLESKGSEDEDEQNLREIRPKENEDNDIKAKSSPVNVVSPSLTQNIQTDTSLQKLNNNQSFVAINQLETPKASKPTLFKNVSMSLNIFQRDSKDSADNDAMDMVDSSLSNMDSKGKRNSFSLFDKSKSEKMDYRIENIDNNSGMKSKSARLFRDNDLQKDKSNKNNTKKKSFNFPFRKSNDNIKLKETQNNTQNLEKAFEQARAELKSCSTEELDPLPNVPSPSSNIPSTECNETIVEVSTVPPMTFHSKNDDTKVNFHLPESFPKKNSQKSNSESNNILFEVEDTPLTSKTSDHDNIHGSREDLGKGVTMGPTSTTLHSNPNKSITTTRYIKDMNDDSDLTLADGKASNKTSIRANINLRSNQINIYHPEEYQVEKDPDAMLDKEIIDLDPSTLNPRQLFEYRYSQYHPQRVVAYHEMKHTLERKRGEDCASQEYDDDVAFAGYSADHPINKLQSSRSSPLAKVIKMKYDIQLNRGQLYSQYEKHMMLSQRTTYNNNEINSQVSKQPTDTLAPGKLLAQRFLEVCEGNSVYSFSFFRDLDDRLAESNRYLTRLKEEKASKENKASSIASQGQNKAIIIPPGLRANKSLTPGMKLVLSGYDRNIIKSFN